MSSNRKNHNAGLRKKTPGFPWKRKFRTKEEANAYFASEKIQCLLCGEWLKKLDGFHLTTIHGITADEYREMYGLPGSRSLDGAPVHGKSVESTGRGHAKGNKTRTISESRSGKASSSGSLEPFPVTGAPGGIRKAKTRGPNPKYRRKHYEAILERMRSQERILIDVCGDPDMPSRDSWRKYAAKHPEMKKKYRNVLYGLPYFLQTRCGVFSPQFSIDCQAMRDRGMGVKKIANTLGVDYQTVRRILEESPGGFRPLDHTGGGWKYRRKDFEAILERMRSQQRTLTDVCRDPDMPSREAWKVHVRRHPEFMKNYRNVLYGLPYFLQARCVDLSPRFRIDCLAMRDRGMDVKKIANALGVARQTVRRILEESPGGFRRLDRTGLVRPKWRREDYEAILERMRSQQRTLNDVCRDPDMPSRDSWRAYVVKHPEMKKNYRNVLYGMSYSLQARSGDLSPRFRIDCLAMRDRGMDVKRITSALGVSYRTVKKTLEGKPTGFRPPHKKGLRRKWRREDYEAILDRMRIEHRLLYDVCGDPDMAPFKAFNNYTKKHPEFREKIKETYYSLPYSLQVRSVVVSPRLGFDCRRLRSGGMKKTKIADALGIGHGIVNRMLG